MRSPCGTSNCPSQGCQEGQSYLLLMSVEPWSCLGFSLLLPNSHSQLSLRLDQTQLLSSFC